MEKQEPYTTGHVVKKKGVKYGQCRRNHAARIGGYAVDGCREFIPIGEDGTRAAFECAACHCHRSFHERHEEAEEWSESTSFPSK